MMSLLNFLPHNPLNSVAKILLEGHVKGCVVDRLSNGDNEVIDELIVTIQKLMKK